MERKILIAVDDSPFTKRCLEYVAGLFPRDPGCHCALFHLQPPVSQYLQEEAANDPWAGAELKRVARKNAEAAEKLAARAKAALIGMGFPKSRISVETPMRRQGVAKDILEAALERSYDAIVVGRRGLSRWQQALMGSVSAKLVANSQVTPVWIVDGSPTGRRFLLAVDGSENALRLVDHVGFMLAGDPTVRMVLFHVPRSSGDISEASAHESGHSPDRSGKLAGRAMMGDWIDNARAVLGKAGIGPEQVAIRIARGRGQAARRIMETARTLDCGTVVVGKRGIDRAFYWGSVSHAVAQSIRNRAMWLVP